MAREHSPKEDGERPTERSVQTSRRRFLEATGVAGLVGGVGGFALAQDDGATTYEFGGEVAGWQGQSPSEIEGETNPTLQLEAGTEYEISWENLDGQPHDFVIQDEEGNEIEGTEIYDEQGETHSFTFTASEEMSQYICTVHPNSMVGDIQVGEGGGGAQTEDEEAQRYVPEGPTVGAELVADGPLVNPVTLRTVPGQEDTHLIVDQAGQIYVHQDGELDEEPFLDISERVVMLAPTDGEFERSEGFDERGLLGMDFHPNFEENGQFYVRYSAAEGAEDTLIGPGERELPDDWDHVEVLSEFQATVGGVESPTAGDGATDGNETTAANGNDTVAEGDNETMAAGGNETAAANGNETAGGAETAGGGPQLQANRESERILLEVPQPQFNHNAGEVLFGPDGYLYTTYGDGGGANDTHPGHVEDWYDDNEGGNGQDITENLLGTTVRIDVDQEGEDRPYAIPDDNPFVDSEEAFDEIFAYGLRNPWRASFNDGDLITADVGQALFEEVHVLENGANYGWNVKEGFHCFDAADATSPPSECPTNEPDEAPYTGQELRDPVLEYPHSYEGTPVGISITGGYVYQGDELSELSGGYIFGDWSRNFAEPDGRVFVATPDGQAGDATPGDDGTPMDDAGNESVDQAGNESVDAMGNETNGTMGNESVDQDADVEVDGNETAGNQTAGNGTAGNQTAGNETAGNETNGENGGDEEEAPAPDEQVDVPLPSEQPWQFEEVMFEGGENQEINRFIQAFGRDANGELYVLVSRTGRLETQAGEVYRLVAAGEGDELTQPEVETPGEGDGDAEVETEGEGQAEGESEDDGQEGEDEGEGVNESEGQNEGEPTETPAESE